MPNLTIEKTYEDGVTPTSADFDNICDSLETFLNVTKLGADNIADNSITASSTFVAESISADKIQNLAVTTAKIVDGAATAAKFATGAVTTAKILDDNVTTAKIATGAVTSAKLDDGAITYAKKGAPSIVLSGSSLNSSSFSPSYASTISTSLVRPLIYTISGSSLIIVRNSGLGYSVGGVFLQKNGSVTNVSVAGCYLDEGGGITSLMVMPSSSIFYIDTSEYSTSTSTSYRVGISAISSSGDTYLGATSNWSEIT